MGVVQKLDSSSRSRHAVAEKIVKKIRGSHDRDAIVTDIYGIIISGISSGFITFHTLFDYKNSSSVAFFEWEARLDTVL